MTEQMFAGPLLKRSPTAPLMQELYEAAELRGLLALMCVGLRLGGIVLGGSFTRPADIAADEVIHADHGALGTIRISFF